MCIAAVGNCNGSCLAGDVNMFGFADNAAGLIRSCGGTAHFPTKMFFACSFRWGWGNMIPNVPECDRAVGEE